MTVSTNDTQHYCIMLIVIIQCRIFIVMLIVIKLSVVILSAVAPKCVLTPMCILSKLDFYWGECFYTFLSFLSRNRTFIKKKIFLGGVWSFRNKDKPSLPAPEAPGCHNWLQSGCPLNNNMVIHQCDVISSEEQAKQDQIRGLKPCSKHLGPITLVQAPWSKLLGPSTLVQANDTFS
jgi:hypothetical protein